jgi:hypothetical protein
MDMMIDAKQQISDWTEIDKDSLNDISLEDVEMSEYAQENVESATHQMMADDPQDSNREMPGSLPATRPICKSYWVEHTSELVLFIWNTHQAKTIVIPEEGWMLRDDITIH